MLKSSRSDYTEDLGMITNELIRMDSALKMISMMYKGTGILTRRSKTSVVSGVEDFALVIEPDLQLALDARSHGGYAYDSELAQERERLDHRLLEW
jgi:hypothetical protein